MSRLKIKEQATIFYILFVAIFFATVSALECIPLQGYNGCACGMNMSNTTSNPSRVINLLPLADNSSVPRFTTTDVTQKWKFSYNPCSEFSMFVGENGTAGYRACSNVSAARWTNQSTHQCDSLGNQKSAKFNIYEGSMPQHVVSNLTVTFMNSVMQYSAVISLVCKKTVMGNESTFMFVGEIDHPHNTYYFSLTSECCCPGRCGIPPAKDKHSKKKGKSTGGEGNSVKKWITVVAAVGGFIVLVLLIAGVVCCARKRRGYERV